MEICFSNDLVKILYLDDGRGIFADIWVKRIFIALYFIRKTFCIPRVL